MKKAIKRIVGIITAVFVSVSFGEGYTTVNALQVDSSVNNPVTSVATASVSSADLNEHYATNPNGKCGAEKTIKSIDDFTSDMLIAQGAANDDARVYRVQDDGSSGSMHEKPVDTFALYGAWDDSNIYIMWIMTNMTDVAFADQNNPICDYGKTDNGKPWNGDLAQLLLFNIDPTRGGSGANLEKSEKTGAISQAPYLWNIKANFETKVDKVALIHSNNSTSAQVIASLNDDDLFDQPNGVKFNTAKGATTGPRFTWVDGLPSCVKNEYGITGWGPRRKVGDMIGDGGKWVDFLAAGSVHDKKQDTTYLMTIPMESLGITKSDLTSKGIGLMHMTTFGASGMDCVPYDMSMNDAAAEACPQDASSSGEKEDFDVITAPLASLGKLRNPSVVNVKPIPTITTDVTGEQPVNKKIKFNVDVASGEAPYKYQYYVDDEKVGEETDSSTFEWTPTKAGDYTIKVLVKDSKGNKGQKEKKVTIASNGGSVTPDDPKPDDPKPIDPKPDDPTSIQVVLSASDLKVTGDKIVNSAISIKEAAAGGDGDYKYKFSITKAGKVVASQSYKSADTFSWTPDSAGDYEIKATVKDGNGTEVDKSQTITIKTAGSKEPTVTPNPEKPDEQELTASLKLDKKGTQKANTKIRLNASSEGGSGAYRYEFIIKKDGKEIIDTKSTSTSYFDWTPTEAGKYKLSVSVVDGKGQQMESVDSTIEITAAASQNNDPQIPPIDNPALKPGTGSDVATKSDHNANPGDKPNAGDTNSILPISIMLLLSVAGISVKYDKKKEKI